jgi:hypothetical protein
LIFLSFVINRLHGISFDALTRLSACPPESDRLSSYAQTFQLEATKFKRLADATTAGSALSLKLAHVEMVLADMSVMVQSGNLNSGGVIVASLQDCILEAKNATRGLQRLTSKIGGAADR